MLTVQNISKSAGNGTTGSKQPVTKAASRLVPPLTISHFYPLCLDKSCAIKLGKKIKKDFVYIYFGENKKICVYLFWWNLENMFIDQGCWDVLRTNLLAGGISSYIATVFYNRVAAVPVIFWALSRFLTVSWQPLPWYFVCQIVNRSNTR